VRRNTIRWGPELTPFLAAHRPGVAKLEVSLDGEVISEAVKFTYKSQNGSTAAEERHLEEEEAAAAAAVGDIFGDSQLQEELAMLENNLGLSSSCGRDEDGSAEVAALRKVLSSVLVADGDKYQKEKVNMNINIRSRG